VAYAHALAVFATLSFCVIAVVAWYVTKPRTRWLIERVFWVLFGILFGVATLLSILSIYGEQ